jgi:pyridoxal phosphate enzyme (YggS family)
MTAPASSVDAFREAHAEVVARIAAACARAARQPTEVTLVAVSKTVDAQRLRLAVEAGITILGENRVQEAVDKRPAVEGATWHLVGPLQSNKARRALQVFDVIQSVSSLDLGQRLDRLADEVVPGRRVPILVQVNVDADPAKAGVLPVDAPALVAGLVALPRLDVRGLMTIGRFGVSADETRTTFAGLRTMGERLRQAVGGLGPDLSMGMSDDFEIAVEEGATIVRVGRALFGERPHAHDPGGPEHVHG